MTFWSVHPSVASSNNPKEFWCASKKFLHALLYRLGTVEVLRNFLAMYCLLLGPFGYVPFSILRGFLSRLDRYNIPQKPILAQNFARWCRSCMPNTNGLLGHASRPKMPQQQIPMPVNQLVRAWPEAFISSALIKGYFKQHWRYVFCHHVLKIPCIFAYITALSLLKSKVLYLKIICQSRQTNLKI